MERLSFADYIDMDILQIIQDNFSIFTGLNLVVTDTKGNHLTQSSGGPEFCQKYVLSNEEGRKRCVECYTRCADLAYSGEKAAFCTCHAGMSEMTVPIFIDGKIVGTIVAGQVRLNDPDEEALSALAKELGYAPNEFLEAARRVPSMSQERLESVVRFLSECSDALSQMVNANYKKRKELENAERVARSHTEFITDLTSNLRESMAGWIDQLVAASDRYKDMPEIKQDAENLLLQAGEAYSQISGAVDYIRMASGSTEYSEGVYNVRGLLDRTAASIRNKSGSKNIEVSTVISDDLPEMLAGNSGRIEQVLGKLCTSLVNYTNTDGHIELSASCKRKSYSCSLVINIIGTGTRMTPRAAEAIGILINGGDVSLFGAGSRVTAKDADFRLIVILLRQMSGTLEAVSLADGNVSFRIVIPQLDGSIQSI